MGRLFAILAVLLLGPLAALAQSQNVPTPATTYTGPTVPTVCITNLATGAIGPCGGGGGGGNSTIIGPLGPQTAAASVATTINGTLPAFAATPTVTVGNASIAVTVASLPLPTGAATSALQTTGNTSLATIAGNVPIANGQNLGGFEFDVVTTPTIQNASYVSGNCMGGFQAISVARISGGAGILNTVSLASKGGLATGKVIYVFNQNPSSSTCTDKSTFTLNNADIGKLLVAPFTLTPTAPTGTTVTIASQTNMANSFVTNGNANIYVAIVETTTETPASTTDLVLTTTGIQD